MISICMEKRIEASARTEEKLEQFLHRELGLTMRQIRQAKYRENGICINGIRSRVTEVLNPGDVVTVLLEEAEEESSQLIPGDGELRILYEDEDVLAVDKPAGVVVHPSPGHYGDSLSNTAVRYFREKSLSVKIRSVGRLDKDTSGIVLFAKNQVAAARLSEQKISGACEKEYLALASGIPKPRTGTVCTHLMKDPESRMKMKVTDQGLPAVTHYEVIQVFETYSLLRVLIETGRAHQIRVHMASIGHPLLGDLLYGNDRCMERTALHAASCRFLQPFTGEEICLLADLPEDMKKMIDLRKER